MPRSAGRRNAPDVAPTAERGATTRRRQSRRVGLALAGGGPLGGIYEVGALLALADSLDGIDFNDLDTYVGVSSGGFVAAALANGISPAQMYRLFIDDVGNETMSPRVFLRPALGEFWRRLRALPGLSLRASLRYVRAPMHAGLSESIATLSRALPVGVFDNAAIDAFLSRLLSAHGRSNDFRKLKSKLYLVATNLDTGAPVVFGSKDHDHVPISRAIGASSALPGLFPPVEIDGEHYVDGALNKTLHASVALDDGVSLLLCINPLVPYDARAVPQHARVVNEKLNHGGLPLVLSQTFRAIIHSRMRGGFEKYRLQYPGADVVLFEPDREDAQMFFANIFSYRQRKQICALAYEKTRRDLALRKVALEPAFTRHGIALRRERLADTSRRVGDAVGDPRPLHVSAEDRTSVRRTARNLERALDALERYLIGA
ncbi:MAG TPA: patatin-like phospholipase family protein [Casimicrobiaceae bacterium]|nr:patatin-like phospholipase family protein [Casimicrobiaceae bacterium]